MSRINPLAGILLCAALAITSGGCGEKGKADRGGEKPPVVAGATVQKVSVESLTDYFPVAGTVRSATVANVAARIAGTVVAVHVRDGDRVARGKLLLTLRADETLSGAAGAKAAVEEARRGVEEAGARKILAEATFGRFEMLFRDQAVTKQEFDTRRMERDVAQQGFSRAEARLTQAREQAKSAATLAGYTKITAPVSGIVTGKAVDPGATVFPGMTLLTVEDEGKFRLEAAVPDALSSKIKAGQALTVKIDDTNAELQGTVEEVAPVADPVSRTRTVKIALPAKGIRSGMFGRAALPVGTVSGILLPRSAVVERGMLTSVWTVDKDNFAHMRLVKTGREAGGRVEILSGLSDGERVVTGGAEKVIEGAKVE